MNASFQSRRTGTPPTARPGTGSPPDPSSLLRVLLGIDAATCLSFGIVLVGGNGAVARLTGLSAALLLEAGGVLFAFGAFVAWAASRRPVRRLAVLAIVDLNVLWAIASVALACLDDAATPLGRALVAAQGVAVGVVGIAELLAGRRIGTTGSERLDQGR